MSSDTVLSPWIDHYPDLTAAADHEPAGFPNGIATAFNRFPTRTRMPYGAALSPVNT